MARLTEEMVIARSKQSDLSAIKKLNCWGAELGDVSLLRRMPNVEVLAFSINKIRTLGDFAGCRRLRELYVRKNEIRDLHEIRHLRRLPDLTSLWLDENPCTQHPEYRMTVLRNLPNLEKLDNVPVHPEEVQEAMRRGAHIPDSDDEGYPQQQETYGQYRRQRSCESSPDREHDHHPPPHAHSHHHSHPHYNTGRPSTGSRHDQGSDSSEAGGDQPETRTDILQCPVSPTRRPVQSPDSEERYEHPPSAMTRSQIDTRSCARSPDAPGPGPLRHSLSALSVKEYQYSSNGECRYSGGGGGGGSTGGGGEPRSPPHYNDAYYEKPDRSESYQQVPQRCSGSVSEVWEQDRGSARDRDRDYPSAVMAEHRGFTRRPVARNSNLLSAVLCLVKELDYPSLEVAEMAVRCRMDELANSQ